MSSSMTRCKAHAAAMEQTALYYDRIVATPTRDAPLYSRNSINPFWTAEGCISGGMWGPATEYTEHACAVRDAYVFKKRPATQTYPALETPDGSVIELQFKFYETKSLVFKNDSNDQNTIETTDFQYEGDPDEYQFDTADERSQEKEIKDVKKLAKETAEDVVRYRRVTDSEINAEYARYLTGGTDEESILKVLIGFAEWKLAYSRKESKLSLLEQDQLLSKFMEKMDRVIRKRMYSGTNGSPFSNYVKSTWARTRTDGFRSQKRFKERFERSEWQVPEGSDEDGDFRISKEDAASFSTYRDSRPDQDRETALLIHELRSRLSKADLAIFESLRDSNQNETADRLGINRHSVARAQERIEKAGRKVLLSLKLSKVVA